MKRRLAAALICAILLGCGFSAAAAAADTPQLSVVARQPLSFSGPPIRIEQAEWLPNGHLAVIYFSQGAQKDEELLWLDLFAASGARLLSRRLGRHLPDVSPYPFAQLLVHSKRFICEYYPDITTMEVCFQSTYSLDGQALKADQRSTLRYGDASYARNIGQYILRRQAHGYDEEHADPFFQLEIIHVPTGKALRTKTWAPLLVAFADDAGSLWIVQKNERENLEMRAYAASDTVQESIVDMAEPALQAHEFTAFHAAVWHQGAARLLVYVPNADCVLLTYDPDRQQVTARSPLTALPGAHYISGLASTGPHLLAVNELLDEQTQQFSKQLGLIDPQSAQHPLHFAGLAFHVFADAGEGTIRTLEKNQDTNRWWRCEYALRAP